MILISLLLLVGAIVTLVIGWLQEGLSMVFVSIGVSVAAGLFLAAGMIRRRAVTPATAGGPYGPAQGTKAAATAPAEPKERAKPRAPLPQRRPAAKKPTGRPKEPVAPATETLVAQPPAKKTATKKTTAKKTTAKKTTAKKTTAKKAATKKPPAKKTATKKTTAKKTPAKKTAAASRPSPRSRVVSIPERGTFHRSDCRYVKGRRDTERITLGTAEKRGYSSCGVCKPTI